ncbi:peptidylprolyl isomerase [Paenibacillus albus]|uniref:peptidylprolyl isomerase n=1 Tax=Paenibacillus albus TaxID=2495582 RepID=A0A3Q8X6U1_9BACL|nr:peptidylprolyl isomerase [Paenibacillus albus]AZN41675.1 hypothetical protein EJC50_19830 [Paenibacillus albus]
MNDRDPIAVSVNDKEWRLRDVLKFATIEGRLFAVDDTVRSAVIIEFAEKNEISVEEQEWIDEANELRKRKGLYSAAETMEWLNRRGLDKNDLFEAAKLLLLTEKAKRIVASEERIEAYFWDNRMAFDRANVSQLIALGKDQAQELLFQLEEGISFYALAQTYCCSDSSKYNGGYIGWIGRTQLSGEEEASVFAAEAKQTVGPFPFGSYYRLLHVWEVRPAELTEETRMAIADALFEAWLKEAITNARVDIGLWGYLAGEQV